VCALLAACGDNLLPPQSYDEFAHAYDDAVGRWNVRCGLLLDSATWDWVHPTTGVSADLLSAIDAGVAEYHPDVAYECLQWVEQLSCQRNGVERQLPHCFGIITGTLHDGESCAFGLECISRECWFGSGDCTDACCRGVCTGDSPPVIGHVGDRCRYSGCAESYCDGNLCLALLQKGAGCEYDSQCEAGLVCDGGLCAVPPGPGEPCLDACSDFGLTCRTDQAICVRVGWPGDPCTFNSDCSYHYRCVDKQCAAMADRGERCFYDDCRAPYVCDTYETYKCIDLKRDGEPCHFGIQCTSGSCTLGACTSDVCI
jgi:hypothetical protein